MVNADRLGKRIKEARQEKHLTGEQLAEKLSISLGFLRELERGGKKPSLDTLIIIANELEVSADELLCDSVNKAQPIVLGNIAKKLEGLSTEKLLFIEKMIDSMVDAFVK
ncbi:MAG: helix-turn-helix transcriptional regulator [Ruminococcaceae bacterium]|nr:helix-turn-helix transcriptional regulator [Oscillospiraceae bacterium]